MFLKNFHYALRNLSRDKFYAFIHISGLSIGIAAALLIFGWTRNELSHDRFHLNGDRMARVLTNWSFGGDREWSANTPAPLAPALRAEIPELESATRVWQSWGGVFKVEEKRTKANDVIFVEPSFFEVFDFPLISGDPASVLAAPGNIVLTESLARKLFGSRNPIGKNLRYNNQLELQVTGVMKDCPANSHLQFTCLVPFDGNVAGFVGGEEQMHWRNFSYLTYVLLQPEADKTAVEEKLTALYQAKSVNPSAEAEEGETFLALQPIREVYFHSHMLAYNGFPSGNLKTLRIIGMIGVLILVIACINYVNLTTARAVQRAKSTGVRKIAGASRGQLFGQFLTETALLVGVACIVAVVLTDLSLPLFEALSGKTFTRDQLLGGGMLSILAGTAFAAVFLSGVQPALQLSAFQPAKALRGSSWKTEKNWMRKLLVVGQFAGSAILIVSAILMYHQMNFVKKSKLGYDREHVFTFYTGSGNVDAMKTELLAEPGILDVVSSDQTVVDLGSMNGGSVWEGKKPEAQSQLWHINTDQRYPAFYGLQLQEGRWFLPGKADSASFIINETAAKYMGLTEPVGKWFDFNGTKGVIVGVAKDFHFKSLHHPIEPLVIWQRPEWHWLLNVKTDGQQTAKAIAAAERVFKKHNPDDLFSYSFLDESYNQLYTSETRSGRLFLLFAGIAVFISCLGIFGLAAYTAERRTKEIGIRKVLGAGVPGIIGLLSKDFLQLVLFALVIATPTAWFFMNRWLQTFAYHVDIEWWVFALAGGLAIGIALLVVGFQSVRAALANPVSALKSE